MPDSNATDSFFKQLQQQPILALAFRPFFFSAMVFTALAMLIWLAQSQGLSRHFQFSGSANLWHAHEMLYGYGMAVISGFLLTAVRNWTGVQTIHGNALLGLWLLWSLARVGSLLALPIMATGFGLAFLLGLILAFSQPIVMVKQWKQIGLISKLVLLFIGELLFALGEFGYLAEGQNWGIGIGLYLILALVMVLARRVVPFFIGKVAGPGVVLKNPRWLDIGNLLVFALFSVQAIFSPQHPSGPWLALGLFALNSLRLYNWHSPAIWRSPMLWVLYLAYMGLTMGFLLTAMPLIATIIPIFKPLSLAPLLATHAFTIGSIGLLTSGMMARVALGHTGRSVYQPPKAAHISFALIGIAFVARVLVPLFWPGFYSSGILIAQITWISAFGLLAVAYWPILSRERVDGKPG